MRPRIKICCIQSPAEAARAINHGASALGLVSAMPSGPGVINEERIAQQRRCRTNTLQLCDYVPVAAYPQLRVELPGIALVQVIHVTGPEAVDYAVDAASQVDALLLDSGNPALAVKHLGGTGRTHNWRLSRGIRDTVQVPVFLAGGLNASNVAEAVAAVQPFGLDVCSGVRTDDKLDPAKLRAFFDTAQDGDVSEC